MIRLPKNLAQAVAHAAHHDVRAGGTDLQDRRRLGLTARPLLDLRDVTGLEDIEDHAGGLKIGARVRLADLAEHARVLAEYPAVAEGAGGLATPQIRAVATLAGNLLQAPRCSYYRHHAVRCLRSGGEGCPARVGDHLWHVCFDHRACVAPNASTMAVVLAAYDAELDIAGAATRTVEALYELGSGDKNADHNLEAGALVTHVRLPPPWPREQAVYTRATSRARSEWALVEVAARLRLDDQQRIADARVAVGAVASAPLRLRAVEQLLIGQAPGAELFEHAGVKATAGANPLPQTGYKVELMQALVTDALTIASERTPSAAAPRPADEVAPDEGGAP